MTARVGRIPSVITENKKMSFRNLNRIFMISNPTGIEKRIVRKSLDGLKVLGGGELTKKITVKATVFSATAKEKIEAAGGKIEEV